MWFGNDITKCFGEGCPVRDNCYRYTVKPDRYQSYSDFTQLIKDGKCEYFWEDKNERNQT